MFDYLITTLNLQGHSTLFFKLTLFLYEERSKSKPMTLLLASNSSLVPSQTIISLLLSSELAEESEYERISNQLQRGNLGHDSSLRLPPPPSNLLRGGLRNQPTSAKNTPWTFRTTQLKLKSGFTGTSVSMNSVSIKKSHIQSLGS